MKVHSVLEIVELKKSRFPSDPPDSSIVSTFRTTYGYLEVLEASNCSTVSSSDDGQAMEAVDLLSFRDDLKHWSHQEIVGYLEAFRQHPKNFFEISKSLNGSKTTKECVYFYYHVDKSLFPRESRGLRDQDQTKRRIVLDEVLLPILPTTHWLFVGFFIFYIT